MRIRAGLRRERHRVQGRPSIGGGWEPCRSCWRLRSSAIKFVRPRLVQKKACQGLPDERGQYLASYGEHGNRGPGGDDRVLMLQEVLYMCEWIATLARRAGRREPRKSPLCHLQAATINRSDTAIADERRH